MYEAPLSHDPVRRALLIAAGVSFFALATGAARAGALGGAAGAHLQTIIERADALAASLRAGELSAPSWQDAMAALVAEAPVQEFAGAIDFGRLMSQTVPPEKGVATAKVALPRVDPASGVIGVKLFVVGKGRAIIPHGHVGMTSGHLVMKGALHRRQYDRVAMADDVWTLRQTIDANDGVGAFSSISDERDNIHWLIAEELSATLDFIMAPSQKDGGWDIQNLDMDAATRDGDLIRASTINVGAALAKYG